MLTSEASYAIQTFPLLGSFRFYYGNCSMSHNVGFVFPESNTVFEIWPLWHFWVPVSLPTQAQVAISWVFLNMIWKPYSCAEECWLSRELGAKIKAQHTKFPVSQSRATTTSNRWHFRHTGFLRAVKASPFPPALSIHLCFETVCSLPIVPRLTNSAHPYFWTSGCCFDTGSCYAAALALNSRSSCFCLLTQGQPWAHLACLQHCR